nr:epimerase family protein SDR39U1 homolog, chloroplastic [Ipomoea batatas]
MALGHWATTLLAYYYFISSVIFSTRLDALDSRSYSSAAIIPLLLRFKVADRTPLRLLLSSVAAVAQPRRKVNKEIKESRIRATSKKTTMFQSNFQITGTSETQVFDEQSPSGKDYLAELGDKNSLFVVKHSPSIPTIIIGMNVSLGSPKRAGVSSTFAVF